MAAGTTDQVSKQDIDASGEQDWPPYGQRWNVVDNSDRGSVHVVPQNSAWSTQSRRTGARGQDRVWLVVKRLELFHSHDPLLPALRYMAHHKLAGREEGLV